MVPSSNSPTLSLAPVTATAHKTPCERGPRLFRHLPLMLPQFLNLVAATLTRFWNPSNLPPPPCLCPAIPTAQTRFLLTPSHPAISFPQFSAGFPGFVSPSSPLPVPCFTAMLLARVVLFASASLVTCAHWLAIGCCPHSVPLAAWDLPQVICAATLCYMRSLDALRPSPWGQTLGGLRWVRPAFPLPCPEAMIVEQQQGWRKPPAARRWRKACLWALSHLAGPLGRGECNPDTIGLWQNHTPQTISWQNMGQLER